MASAIEPVDLQSQIESGHPPVILDVRSKKEYDSGHVPGALLVPFWRVKSTMPTLPIQPGAPLVVLLRARSAGLHGRGSALRRLGYTRITYLAGHMSRWRRRRQKPDVLRSRFYVLPAALFVRMNVERKRTVNCGQRRVPTLMRPACAASPVRRGSLTRANG